MNESVLQSGIMLTEIHGVYLLVADRKAREHCPYIRLVNEPAAMIWKGLLAGKSRGEIVRQISQEYEIPEGVDPGVDVDSFVNALKEDHYINCEAKKHEV